MWEAKLKGHLIACADACVAAGMTRAAVGQRFADDHQFFKQLNERTVTLKKLDEVMVRFAEDWPAAARWPRGVPRPKHEAA